MSGIMYTFDIRQSTVNTRYYSVSVKANGFYVMNCPRTFTSTKKANSWIEGWKQGMHYSSQGLVSIKKITYPARKDSPNWKAFLMSQTREFKDYGLKFYVNSINNTLSVNGREIKSGIEFKTAYTDGFVNGCVAYHKEQ